MLHILWDDSHIWGLLAVRAARAMDLPHRLVRGRDVAQGLLARERPSLLLVPGGNARHKAESLGDAGIAAVRDYVRSGGRYVGFCGGAGLALTWEEKPQGLGLCPWRRAGFDDRLQHFMSGHLHVVLPAQERWAVPVGVEHALPDSRRNSQRSGRTDESERFAGETGRFAAGAAEHNRTATDPEKNDQNATGAAGNGPAMACPPLLPETMPESPRLPVWWPGRFAPEASEGITVLASYDRPGDDFWLADLPIADLPSDIFSTWQALYGLSLTPSFLVGQPCVIHGCYGNGHYVLSYSHLETPDSPQANRWLAHLLRALGGLCPSSNVLPPWRPRAASPLWDDPDLTHLARLFEEVRETGLKHGQLFCRTDWLMGWRTGIPGANLNNIWAALSLIRSLAPTAAARAYWNERRERLIAAAELFATGSIQYLLAERLAMTLAKPLPEAVPAAMLKDQRESLFGPPMRAGGLYQEIIDPLDTLAYLQLS